MLFETWADAPLRATGDVDFLSFGNSGVETATARARGKLLKRHPTKWTNTSRLILDHPHSNPAAT